MLENDTAHQINYEYNNIQSVKEAVGMCFFYHSFNFLNLLLLIFIELLITHIITKTQSRIFDQSNIYFYQNNRNSVCFYVTEDIPITVPRRATDKEARPSPYLTSIEL